MFEGGFPGELQSRALASYRTMEYLRTTPTLISGSVRAWAARQDNNARINRDEVPSPKPSPKLKPVPKAGFTSKLNTYHHTAMQSDGNSLTGFTPSNSRKGPVLDETLTEEEDMNDENLDTLKNRLQEEKMSIMM